MVSLASLAHHLKHPGQLWRAFVVAIVTASIQFSLPLAAKWICGVSITTWCFCEGSVLPGTLNLFQTPEAARAPAQVASQPLFCEGFVLPAHRQVVLVCEGGCGDMSVDQRCCCLPAGVPGGREADGEGGKEGGKEPPSLTCSPAVLILCLWPGLGRRAASVTCPSQTPTQVSSAPPAAAPRRAAGRLTAGVLLRVPGSLGDTRFSFRFRQSVGRRAVKLTEDVYNRDAPVSLQVRNLPGDSAWTLMTSSRTVPSHQVTFCLLRGRCPISLVTSTSDK